MKSFSILHIITGLKVGGAENALHRLIVNSPKELKHEVLCLTKGGAMHEVFLESNIKVITLDFKKAFFNSLFSLIKLIRAKNPDVVQTWLYHANLIGGIAAKIIGVKVIIWGLRGTAIPQSVFSIHSFIIRIGSFLSYIIPSAIVCNANTVSDFHVQKGYSKNKIDIINNGFNIHNETPNKKKLLNEIVGLDSNSLIIGTIGRYDKLKDYPNMINAFSIIMKEFPNVHMLMIGRGLDISNSELMSMLSNSLDISKVHLLGEKSQISEYLNIMDIFCLSSCNEGFPNVVAEAMLMRVPCVVTDAGDASSLISDIGILVPVEDHIKLALGLKYMIEIGSKKREKIGELSYSHIKLNFSIEKNISQFNKLYITLLNEK
jgi:glycosyltransferase involved in cell wall biosynthesis